MKHTFLIHYSSLLKHPSKSEYFIKKARIIRFEDIELTAGGSYSMWNLLRWIRIGVKFKRMVNKKAISFRGPLFWPSDFPGVYINFMGSHVLWPSVFPEFPRQNFLETSAEYIYKGISSTTLLVLFLEHSTDWQIDLLFWVLIYPANCVAKNFLLNLSKMKHVTNYIQNISFSPASQQFTRL